ncbi:protein of unknown function [Methylocaldum szegediense]|uniref:Uncharacterized protein n=1 Tax=Methylocaldum szegediense TaxID=73780 RepID=A0ABM9HY13_9GAMM|nr:protein of unknown function [Methylocaldum szegediense]
MESLFNRKFERRKPPLHHPSRSGKQGRLKEPVKLTAFRFNPGFRFSFSDVQGSGQKATESTSPYPSSYNRLPLIALLFHSAFE